MTSPFAPTTSTTTAPTPQTQPPTPSSLSASQADNSALITSKPHPPARPRLPTSSAPALPTLVTFHSNYY